MGFDISIDKQRFHTESSSKKMGWGGMIFIMLFFLVFILGQGLVTGSSAAATKGESPISAQMHAVTFEGNRARASFTIPGVPGCPSVGLGDNYREIARLANSPDSAITIIRHKTEGYVLYQPGASIMTMFFGLFTMVLATIFSSLMSPIKVRKWRMLFPAFLLALLWGCRLYFGTFQPLFIVQAVPLVIGWLILSRTSDRKVACSRTATVYSARYALVLFAVGLVFGSVGIGLQLWMLDSVRTQISFLHDSRQAPVRVHLSKTETSSRGGRRGGSSSTSYLLVSYANTDGSRHYTVVSDGDTGGLFKKEVRELSKRNFSCLYRQHGEVTGTVSASDPDMVYLCPVSLKDTCLARERLKDFGMMHFLRLFSTPFFLFGLFLIGGAIVPRFLRREGISGNNAAHPHVTYRVLQWVVFPGAALCALYQILVIRGLLTAEMEFPLLTGVTVVAAPVVALIALLVSLKKVKKTGSICNRTPVDSVGGGIK